MLLQKDDSLPFWRSFGDLLMFVLLHVKFSGNTYRNIVKYCMRSHHKLKHITHFMYVHTTRVRTHIHTQMHTHACARTCAHEHACTPIPAHICMHKLAHAHACMCAKMRARAHKHEQHMRMRLHTCTFQHSSAHAIVGKYPVYIPYMPYIRILAGAVFKYGVLRYSYFWGYFAAYIPYIYRNTVPEEV